MKKRKWMALICLSVIMSLLLPAIKTEAGTVQNSSYVTMSPDNLAFTTNYKDKDCVQYPNGTTVDTGIQSSIRELETGEHYYKAEKDSKDVKIGKWVVTYPYGTCCHDGYPDPADPYHGIDFGRQSCLSSYYSGWTAVCADCRESVSPMLMYMSKEAAESITELDLSLDYYYLCPFCNNLEMGAGFGEHLCNKISWNQYQIRYVKNTSNDALVGGYMEDSIHMFNNANEYNGEPITPATHLTMNAYSRVGYEFVEWNTEPDGSGQRFQDGQEIFNLTTKDISEDNAAKIKLYAQWRKSESTLYINPNGGAYAGNTGLTCLKNMYGEYYYVKDDQIQPPNGFTVSFDTQGGQAAASITGTMSFKEWQRTLPFNGIFYNGRFTYFGKDGSEDTLTAVYTRNSITLPPASKPGSSFGGWFYDSTCTQPAGVAGDRITPDQDMTLYAKWVDLVLTAGNNYSDNGGKGAVDLAWSQDDGRSKTYMLYQSRDNVNWIKISGSNDISNENKVGVTIPYAGNQGEYVVTYTGLYTLAAAGAQGNDYDMNTGGLGGSVTGKVWLQAGEKLTFTIGGKNGYNGGGAADMFANGGGCTVVSSNYKGTLLIAGGGGGASSMGNGGAGGSSASVISTGINGESGGAGGGGGYQGGSAGELIKHYHTDTCWRTEDLSYVLMDDANNAGFLSAWMTDYMNQYGQGRMNADIYHNETSAEWEIATGVWGEYYSPEYGMFRSGAHAKGKASTSYYLGQIWGHGRPGTQPSGLLPLGIPTEGNTTMSIQANYSFWDKNDGGWSTADGVWLEVYDQKGNCIFHKDNKNLPWIDGDKEFKEYQGSRWRQGECKWDETIQLPDGTESVTVGFRTSVDGGVWFGLEIESVAFTGGTKTYTTCGMTDGQILSSKPAYGGSNYISTTYVKSYSEAAGTQAGNGSLTIASDSIGYQESLSLGGVTAKDYAAPDAVDLETMEKEALDDRRVAFTWRKPGDNGTPYYHRAESYLQGSTEKLSDSNVTRNVLTSGIMGYYYTVNQNSGTSVFASNGTFFTGERLELALDQAVQYLHLAAVDVAGNVGPTVHIRIGRADDEVAWPLVTGQIAVSSERGSVYPAGVEDAYYVRCDGETPFRMTFDGSVRGQARDSYQVNHTIFRSKATDGTKEQDYDIYTGSRPVADGTFLTQAKDLQKTVTGTPILMDGAYTVTARKDRCQTLNVLQQFLLPEEYHGRTVRVAPVAGADFGDAVTYSLWDEDLKNSVFLIGDGEAPVISGTEILENMELINRDEGNVTLHLTAHDDLSGVKDFHVEIHNSDNVSTKTYTPAMDGSITIDITKDEYIFSGDFTVTIRSTDNVGNERELIYGTTEFALHTEITRILEPHEPVFKAGESGILTITTWGYADRVEVEFPEALLALNPELNRIYVYTEKPKPIQEEQLQFMIPLYTPANENYVITVRAYKGDKKLEDYPALSTIEVDGSVLDEIRTRLR